MIKLSYIIGILLVILSSCNTSTKSYFEGKITYKFELVPKNETMVADNLKNIFGDGYTLSFKEGNFYHEYDGGVFEFDLYRKDDNRVYLKKRGNDTIFWYDCGLIGDKIDKFSFAENKDKILGISCDELIIQFKDKTESQYYNSDSILINPDWLRKFTLDGENLIDQKEKSIYLRNKIDYPSFLFTQTATKISREPVANKIFEIPPGSILIEQK